MSVHVALQCCHVDAYIWYTGMGIAWKDRRSQPAPTLFKNPTI